MSRALLSLLFLVTAIAASGIAHAQTPACGTTLYRSVVFDADMVCPPGVDGLVVAADYVRIDLNGYAMTTSNSVGSRGIRSSGFDGIKIVGPGRIRGFFTSVMIAGGNRLEIRDIDVAGYGTYMWLRNMSDSVIESNRLEMVDIASDSGYRASANRIVGNDADSIRLHGCQTDGNTVSDNDIHPATQFVAVGLEDGAIGNQIVGNRIVEGTVRLGAASANIVADNSIVNVLSNSRIHAGVILAEDPLSCAGSFFGTAAGNTLRGNAIKGGKVGILMAAGSNKSKIVGNRIEGQRDAGISFLAGSDDNYARGNSYGNFPAPPVPVADAGQGNMWP
jgi:nitrous oxidase accessory protein NosD